MGQLDGSTFMHFRPLTFLEYNNSTVTIQNGARGSGWFTAEQKSCMNSSSNLLKFYEGNACGVIYIPVI